MKTVLPLMAAVTGVGMLTNVLSGGKSKNDGPAPATSAAMPDSKGQARRKAPRTLAQPLGATDTVLSGSDTKLGA